MAKLVSTSRQQLQQNHPGETRPMSQNSRYKLNNKEYILISPIQITERTKQQQKNFEFDQFSSPKIKKNQTPS